jgi:hypothetical protein
MSRLFKLFVAMMLVGGPVFGQARTAEKTPDQLKAEIAALQAKTEITALQAKAAEAKALGEAQPVNVRLELTITDQRGDAPPISKTVSMTFADRHNGRIRTQGDVRTATGFRPVILNVDGNASIIRGSTTKALVGLTIEYRPVAGEGDSERATTPNINEMLNVILEDGKPMVVSQSADPVTDRKVKVEAKITLLR